MVLISFKHIYIDLITNFYFCVIELLFYFSVLIIFSVMLIHFLVRRKIDIISMVDKFSLGFGIAFLIISFSESFVVWFAFNSILIRRIETVFLVMLIILLIVKHRPVKFIININLNTILSLLLCSLITLVNILLFFSANFNVGVFWDDIRKYPWISNMYHNLGPTIRSPYIILPASAKFIADSVNLPFQYGYAMLSVFVGFIVLSIFSYFKSMGITHHRNIIWLATIIVLFGSNLAVIPILTNLLGENGLPKMFEYKVLYDYTIDKYGPPQIVGSWIYFKASSFGGAFIFLSQTILNLSKHGTFSKRITIILATLFFSYGLLGGNIILGIMILPLFVYKIFMLGRWKSILTFIIILFCIDAVFKFCLLNQFIIKLSQLTDFIASFFILCFSLVLMFILIMINKQYLIFQARKFSFKNIAIKLSKFTKLRFGVFIIKSLIIIGILIIIISILFETFYFNIIRYSDMWKKNAIFPPFYTIVRTFGWAFLIAIVGANKLKNRTLCEEILLWTIGIVTSLTFILIYSTIDYSTIPFVNRCVSYIILPMGLLILEGLKSILCNKRYMLLIVFMTILSSSYLFWFTLGYYTTGINYAIPMHKKELLDLMLKIPKEGYILIHSEEDADLISSISNAKVIHAERRFSSKENDYAWYYSIFSKGDVNTIRDTLKKLEIEYIIVDFNLLLTNQSEVLKNPDYLKLLEEFELLYQQNNHVVYKTNLFTSYKPLKYPTIPSPLNNFLSIKDYEG